MKSWLSRFVLTLCLCFIGTFSEEPPAFRCDYRYSSTAKGWFKYHEIPVTWSDARIRCALEGAALASPSTPEMKAELTRFINTSDNEEILYEIFTGIHATIAKGDYHSIEGKRLSVIPHTWALTEPDNKNNNESCLTMNSIGQLADVPCDVTRPFVCYRPDTCTRPILNDCGTIDPEYRLDTRTNKCYKFHKVPKTFSKAFLVCSAEGGHLAIINSELEATVLKELFAKYPESSLKGMIWKYVAMVGFNDWDEHTEWRTIHGQTLKEAGYDRFGAGNPDNGAPGQYCGAIFRSGELDDMYCDKADAFICEKSPNYNAACT